MSTIANECSVNGCGIVSANARRGMCPGHYSRWLRYHDTFPDIPLAHKTGAVHKTEYSVWAGMIQRCSNRNTDNYRNYGRRGISVCERWHSFTNFYADMGPRPGRDYQLDRIDNDGNYEPSNCRWVTKSLNCFNRPSRSSVSGYRGVTKNAGGNGNWTAYTKYQQNRIRIGTFPSSAEAAWMYDQFALALWGESAHLNFEYV